MHLRRTLALATGALLLGAPMLSGCGFNAATDKIYTPANGANDRDGSVDVLGAVVVSADDGSGTFIATLANNDNENVTTFEGVTGLDEANITADEGNEPVEIPAGGHVNLANESGFGLTGDEIVAGAYVQLVVEIGTGEQVEMDVPVVNNCGYWEGLDGPPIGCEADPADENADDAASSEAEPR